MNWTEQAQRLLGNLLQLGARKLAALGLIGLAVFGLTGVAGYYLSRPSMETLYAGLDREDVSSIGAALRDADIGFDVAADGTSVMVHYGQTAQARMLLAEKGLPHSSNAGYELYDKMGSLGLTSFMQDVTRLRALEGELARTIQSMSGIKAARVHIVLPDEGSFRRNKQPASASVVIRSSGLDETHAAQAIRHLVAAAVPSMTPDAVTVLSTDGAILASGDDSANAAPGKTLDLERMVTRSIQENIRKTLAPSLGMDNVQISVSAKLNTDQKQTAETIYNPDGRVERSTRTVKETQSSQNNSQQAQTSVTQNLPSGKPASQDGKQSAEETQKKEDLTNYEISSKTVTTNSAGYSIDRLSIAIVLNRSSLLASLGEKSGSEIDPKRLADIEMLASSAAGFDKARGDTIKIMAVDFLDNGRSIEPAPTTGLADAVLHQSGTLINAGMVLAVTVLVLLFGIKPLTRILIAEPPQAQFAMASAIGGPIEPRMLPEPTVAIPDVPVSIAMAPPGVMAAAAPAPGAMAGDGTGEDERSLIEDVMNRPRRTPQKRLEQMIEFDEQHAASVLKQWIHRGAPA